MLFVARPAFALEADELLLVVNGNVAQGVELAEFYASARGVPDGRIVRLDLPPWEEIPFDRYERDIVPPIRQFLRDNDLEDRVKCLVTFYGMPIRIAGKPVTPEEKEELTTLREDLAATKARVEPLVRQAEALARKVSPAFELPPIPGDAAGDWPGLVARAERAMEAVARGTRGDHRSPANREALGELFTLVTELAGPAAVARHFSDEGIRAIAPPEQAGRWPALRREVERAGPVIADLTDQRYDASARMSVRHATRDYNGLFGLAGVLKGQIDYLDNDGTAAAVDSELALLWWGYYPRGKWLANPLHYRVPDGAGSGPMMMVSRLDAPTPELVRQMVLASLGAERRGLAGRIVVDTRGLPTTKPSGAADSYGEYDQTLRDFAAIARARTDLPVTLDERGEVLPRGSLHGVALYCGWYSVRNYVPSMRFNPGAVGFHVASFEMLSLRKEDERGWVRGLLNDGIAATAGSVAEPYLFAFPKADEFFPLLLTGRPTLAEAYWSTQVTTSWMMSLIGDPLYRPFAANPQIQIEELPEELREIASRFPAATPTTQPAPSE